MNRADLEAYQDALAEALLDLVDADAILARLHGDPRCAPFADYVATLEPRFLEVSALLAKRWAKVDEEAW